MSTCAYCRAPFNGSAYRGRPFPDRDAASYCCFGCLSLGERERQADSKPRFRFDGFVIRLGIGLLVAGQSMIFGLAISLEEQTPAAVKFGVQAAILAGTLLVIALLGPPLLRNAIAEIRAGRLTIEALFLLTMGGALAASLQSFVTGRGPIFFEVVSVLLVVYSLGKAIGAHSRAAALAASKQWAGALSVCRILDANGRERMLEVGLVLPGDLVEVRPGEAIPVDGLVRSGTGFVSEAAVSGEPFEVVRHPGDTVLAGTASHDATFRIEATAAGNDRQIDRLLEAVEAARQRPSTMQSQADRLGQVFFPLTVLVAGGTFAVWTVLEGWQAGLFNAMSVLLVACPCALGLATPIVVWSALGQLAEHGLIGYSGDFIERLAKVDCVFFDKTGTLTEEQFAIVDIATTEKGAERARLFGLLAIVEEQSQHPVAKPFAQLPKPFAVDERPQVASFTVVPGCGVEARIITLAGGGHDPQAIRIGRPEWIGSPDAAGLLAGLHTRTGHRIDCEVDGRLAAIAIVAERLRDSVPGSLESLKALGLPVRVLTGDTAERATALGLPEIRANLLPEAKRQLVLESRQAGGRPLFVGDGINDASALAAADVGITLSSGADLAHQAAAATLYHGDLRVIPWAIELSRDVVRRVRKNLWRAAAYNVFGIALAAGGILHPVAAALLMVVSSLMVAWSSARVGLASSPVGCAPCASGPAIRLKPEQCTIQALIHFAALALQALVLCVLLNLSTAGGIAICTLFALAAAWGARTWLRSPNFSHALDMSFGMLTLGNLGMVLGWWADNGFNPLQDVGCCECAQNLRDGLLKPWMWLGMLLFANVAMRWLMRRPHPEVAGCRIAMLTGGNIGMVLGMVLGGWMASFVEMPSMTLAALASYAGMTVGMIAGMLLGTWMITRIAWQFFHSIPQNAPTRTMSS